MDALWATSGGVLNAYLSTALKGILNHERPVSTLRSDPGMPSSHAQLIFYSVAFCIISMVKYMGFNGITAVTGVLIFAMGSYLVSVELYLVYLLVISGSSISWQSSICLPILQVIHVFFSFILQSWLRVSQRLHTLNQVIVGAVLGFCFSIFWF
ncbi:hypothetical protein T459_06372 [Capsicum annuum]|uniref:Phosphatidic acid phosphatase type 2/haloperoxidase domain-containing protein n=1 Tax=Capsicum annuum TaxID=4072 RepID=A0A2G3AAH6_CAPAN|nr:hypothetical protein T459_06372 [Capsicum annuum]